MKTAKEIRALVYKYRVIDDVRDIGLMTDEEVLEKFSDSFSNDGEMKVGKIIYIPRGGGFENYWRRVDDGTNETYYEWVLDIPDHENDGAKLAMYPLRFQPDEYIIEVYNQCSEDFDTVAGFDEAMKEIHEYMTSLIDIW